MVGARRRPRADIIPEPLSEPAGRPWEAQAGSARDSGRPSFEAVSGRDP
jgi:hypothetical protein